MAGGKMSQTSLDKYAIRGNQWGDTPMEIHEDSDPVRSYKFMTLHRPLTQEYGGHWRMTGAAGKSFYSPMMVAKCNNGMDHPAPNPDCSCGIYSGKKEDVAKGSFEYANPQHFMMELDNYAPNPDAPLLQGTRGFRSSHANILQVHPHSSMQLSQQDKRDIEKDLGVPVGSAWDELPWMSAYKGRTGRY